MGAAQSALATAQHRQSQHEAQHEEDVADAYHEYRMDAQASEASNAVLDDCRVNARPHLGAIGVLIVAALVAAFGARFRM